MSLQIRLLIISIGIATDLNKMKTEQMIVLVDWNYQVSVDDINRLLKQNWKVINSVRCGETSVFYTIERVIA